MTVEPPLGIITHVKTYGQFCPVSQALEILAERWTLLVIRELLTGSHRFSEIQRGVPLMSRTLLSQRLKTLQDCNLVNRRMHDGNPHYELTEAGLALRDIVTGLGVWGKRYAQRRIPDEHLDPTLLMWDMQRRLNVENLPSERTIVLFRLSDAAAGERRFWLHLQRTEIDLCLVPLGFPIDLTVDSSVRTLTEVWMGQRTLQSALRDKSIVLDGSTAIKRAFPTWLALSTFANA